MDNILKNALFFIEQTATHLLALKQGQTTPVPARNLVSMQLPNRPPQGDAGIVARYRSGQISRQEAEHLLNLGNPPVASTTATPPSLNSGVLSPAQIEAGLLSYNPRTPLATQGAALSRGMQTLASNTKINPIDLLTFLLRESQGGLTQAGAYNPGNVRDSTGRHPYVSYPDYNTAINGGWNPEYKTTSQGIVGTILNDPRYTEYRNTGNTNAFNRVWTPEADNNPSAQTLTQQMEDLKKYFRP